jgi:hypothetical protein
MTQQDLEQLIQKEISSDILSMGEPSTWIVTISKKIAAKIIQEQLKEIATSSKKQILYG